VLSSDPAVCEAYLSDPLNQHKTTVRFGHAFLAEQRRVSSSLDRLSIPTLVIHGGSDRLVPTASSEALDDRPGVVRRVYPGVLHELHNEPDGPRVVGDIVDWIRDRVSRMPAPAAG
jgi:acylglycerol lipase